jgi:hypothetical protein
MKVSYAREKSDNIRVLIAKVKAQKQYDNEKMAKCLGLKIGTYYNRLRDPSTFRSGELWRLMQIGKVSDSEKADYL